VANEPCEDCAALVHKNDELEDKITELEMMLADLNAKIKEAKGNTFEAMRYAERLVEAALIEL